MGTGKKHYWGESDCHVACLLYLGIYCAFQSGVGAVVTLCSGCRLLAVSVITGKAEGIFTY